MQKLLDGCPIVLRIDTYKTCKIEKTPRLNAYIICVNGCTHAGGGREEERSRRIQSIVIPTNPSFQHARSLGAAGGYTGNDDNDDNGDNDEYDERGVSPPLSPRGWYNGQVARLSILALFLLSRLLPLDRKSLESIDRSLLSKTGGSSCCSSKADYSTDFPFFFFFFSRGCDRSRNFSTTSGGGVSLVLWDEYWSGFGWRRGISRYIGDRWIQREKMERRCGVTFFCRDSRFAGNRVWKFVGETLIAPFTVPLFSFFFFKFENTFFSRMKFFVRVIEKWFYREREIEIKRLIPIRGKRLIKGIFRRNFEMHFLENGNWHVEISFPRLSTYTFFDEVCRNHTRSNRFWNKVSANGSSLTSMVIYIANTRNFPTGKLLIQMLWNVATSFAPASIARNRRCSGNSSHPANKILSPNSKRNFPRNCDVNACIV